MGLLPSLGFVWVRSIGKVSNLLLHRHCTLSPWLWVAKIEGAGNAPVLEGSFER
jgi:hypothetical protein